MNARELLDLYTRNGIEVIEESRDGPTILRALALLAAVDESDGLVRELDEVGAPGGRYYATAQKARARIVALEAELASVKAERDRLNSAVRWALGYNEGEPQFQPRAEGDPPYWWRNELMRRAAHPKDAP